MRKVILILFILTSYLTNAQIDVIPPSPTAAGLGEYGKVPVSLYSGQANIGIPLYGLQEGSINLDISLSYNSTGNKVDAVSSWVGLGWNLNAGGVITRSINALADESWPDGYLHRIDEISNIIENKLPNEWTGTDINEYLVEVADGKMDAQPDIFYFNFAGHSGSFFFDGDGNIHTVPFQKYKIETVRTSSEIVSFTITDLQGTKYYFGSSDGRTAYDESDTEMICDGDSPFDLPSRTSWYLLKIEDQSGNTVDLFYQSYNLSYHNPNVSESKLYETTSVVAPDGTIQQDYVSFSTCQSIYTISGQHIQKIVTSTMEVEFEAVDDRQEFTGQGFKDLRLDKINIKPIGQSVIKSFEFGQNNTSRLRLESVQEFGKNGEGKPPYLLEYNPVSHAEHTKGQDHWGYYNGQSNSTLIPEYLVGSIEGGNREPSEYYMKAGILEKIIYPTGGHTEFIYEINTALKNSNELSAADCELNPNCNIETYGLALNCDPPSNALCASDSETFTITENEVITLAVNFNMTGMPSNVPDYECNVFVELTDSSGSRVMVQRKGETGYSAAIPALINCGSFGSGGNAIYKANLEPGTYTLDLTKGEDGVTATASVSYMEINESDPSDPVRIVGLAGGLRIKEIHNYDPVTDKQTSRSFDYNTSGILLEEPLYVKYSEELDKTYVTYTSKSQVGLTATKGSHVAYENVTEKIGLNGELGTVEHTYSFYPDGNPFVGIVQPQPINSSNEWRRGIELSTITRNGAGNKINETTYDYNFQDYRNFTEVTGYVVDYNQQYLIVWAYIPDLNTPGVSAENIGYVRLDNTSQWYYLQSRTDKTYDPSDDTKFTAVTTTFNYDVETHAQLTSTSVTHSDGKVIRTELKYPEDYGLPSLAISKMIDKNMIATPIEQIQKVNNQIVGASATGYFYDNTNDRILTDITYNYETTVPGVGFSSPNDGSTFNSYQPKVVFHEYDDKGNVLEVSYEDNISVCYIWGYDQTLPIAKIENASYSQFESLVSNIQNLSDLDDDNCTDSGNCDEKTLRTALNNLRNDSSLSDALVTTYTYDPGVGITSTTDINENTTYYIYDNLSRLLRVIDFEGNTLQEYEYHYSSSN